MLLFLFVLGMTLASIVATVALFTLHGKAMAFSQRMLRRFLPHRARFCPQVEALPKFQNIPVPFFAALHADGRPDFKVINPIRRLRSATERLCFVCGQGLGAEFVFLGGPKSAKSRWYIDGPMHEDCCRDALRVCPFLLGRVDYRVQSVSGGHIFTAVDPHAPDDLVMVKTRWFTIHTMPDGEWLFRAMQPLISEVIPRTHPQPQEA